MDNRFVFFNALLVFFSPGSDEWAAIFDGSDACVSPVLSVAEAPSHPHNLSRNLLRSCFSERGSPEISKFEPSPAPRFSRTPALPSQPVPSVGQHSVEILQSVLDIGALEAKIMIEAGVIVQDQTSEAGALRSRL